FARRDHLLGVTQLLTGFGQRDAANAITAKGDGLLPTVDGVVVTERDRPGWSHGHIETFPVIHLVELVPGLEIAQLGIGQHVPLSLFVFDTMLKKRQIYGVFSI